MADSQTTLNFTGSLLAVMLVTTLAGALFLVSKIDIPQPNHDLLLVVVTAIVSNVGNIINYFFGSSVNNKKLADTVASQAQTIGQAQNALTPDAGKTVTIDSGQTATVKASE